MNKFLQSHQAKYFFLLPLKHEHRLKFHTKGFFNQDSVIFHLTLLITTITISNSGFLLAFVIFFRCSLASSSSDLNTLISLLSCSK